ncbi:uncharacterized protein LOC124157834 [Ischnura elegans]|uniref:uncharacterized protein LOC124157834 n=1 Tax=Ischnura elegans TaxID=197161 RepID=UPI001ED881A5|nr:uncharacterized protein LOC124157834 [Ischnura elegans]
MLLASKARWKILIYKLHPLFWMLFIQNHLLFFCLASTVILVNIKPFRGLCSIVALCCDLPGCRTSLPWLCNLVPIISSREGVRRALGGGERIRVRKEEGYFKRQCWRREGRGDRGEGRGSVTRCTGSNQQIEKIYSRRALGGELTARRRRWASREATGGGDPESGGPAAQLRAWAEICDPLTGHD